MKHALGISLSLTLLVGSVLAQGIPETIELPNAGLSESTGLGGPLNAVPQRLPRKLRKKDLVAVFSATLTTEGKLSELNLAGGPLMCCRIADFPQ